MITSFSALAMRLCAYQVRKDDSMFLKMLSEEDVGAVIDGLFKDGCARENGKRIEYADEQN